MLTQRPEGACSEEFGKLLRTTRMQMQSEFLISLAPAFTVNLISEKA